MKMRDTWSEVMLVGDADVDCEADGEEELSRKEPGVCGNPRINFRHLFG